MDDTGETTPCTSRACSICELSKSADAFYKKGSRFESACKDCKKRQRRERYAGEKKSPATTPEQTSEVTIISSENRPQHSYIEPEQADEFWCKKYGRELTEEEQREIKFNLMSLLQALKDAVENE